MGRIMEAFERDQERVHEARMERIRRDRRRRDLWAIVFFILGVLGIANKFRTRRSYNDVEWHVHS